ncbi:hypothetical protein AMQ84_14935 [Paenibacillus riograndensis]|uniref:Uncharacterized protein n=1 Tax=Paenibacillus riograndensis TaxID=483937 RepID=A0A132TZE5_9BACL|nr:hypothetical protein AMQ84_14935 [Paenibacillus riograndensis]KWX89375.1 hypothetical protein AMQ83_00980 [Paenibacillus riograndensis]
MNSGGSYCTNTLRITLSWPHFKYRSAGGFAAGLLIGYNGNMAGILIIRQENGTFDSSFQGAIGPCAAFFGKKEANGLREGT